MCQHALAASQNQISDAKKYLKDNKEKILKEIEISSKETNVEGLFSKTDGETVHVNLQTAEVRIKQKKLNFLKPFHLKFNLNFNFSHNR